MFYNTAFQLPKLNFFYCKLGFAKMYFSFKISLHQEKLPTKMPYFMFFQSKKTSNLPALLTRSEKALLANNY